MHALIRKGKSKYYVSAVFGYFRNVTAEDSYQKYLQKIHSSYFVVWNEEKTALIKCFEMKPDSEYLIPQVIVVDSGRSDWKTEEDGTGGVPFLSREFAESLDHLTEQPADLLELCREYDEGYTYLEYPEITDEKSITDFYWATRGLHDAHIMEEKWDGTELYLKLGGPWGFNVEIWFLGDVEFDTSARHNEEYDPDWYGCSVIRENGFVYLIDETDVPVSQIGPEYCWMKARHMKYHIIPL